ncbi:MAG: hypothetical protein K0R58_2812 [Ramlibacter sp.]|jgi:uncharacterized surface protein with fasciclin (FAS1) repeats|nr:hypothetical protein [Ramlibacter sp.]
MQRRFLLLAPCTLLLAACASMTPPAPVSVADTIARDPQLSTLSGLVQRAGLSETLKAAGPYTVFAPTNEAFAAVPARTMDELAKDPARLKDVLSFHVLPARVMAAEVRTGNARTAQGANVALSRAGDFVTVEEAMVERADIAGTNGVVHKVDRVLMPPRR